MSIVLFFAGICALSLVFFALVVLLIRSVSASIAAGVAELAKAQGEAQAAALAAIQEKVYQDLAGFFQPAAEGQPSEFGNVVAGMGNVIADAIFQKIKMASIGSAGGSAPRTAGGKAANPIMGLIMNYLAGGAAGGLASLAGAGQGEISPGNNHSNGSNQNTFGI